jgi:hypothetical protein
MKKLVGVCLVLVMLGLVVGCNKGAGTGGAEQSKAFQSAPPETKAMWEAGLSASKTNDYAAAYLILRKLAAQPNLSPEQTKLISDETAAVNSRMSEAASKGDANAKKAMQDIRQSYRDLQRPR